MKEVTILGCGSSSGVPIITCECNVCSSNDPYNKRLRSAALVRSGTTTVLIDCGFDIRTQLLAEKVKHIDAVILTHAHADHIMGLDHLRTFYHNTGKHVPVYVDPTTFAVGSITFGYMVSMGSIKLNKVDYYDKIKIGDIEFQVFRQYHAEIDSLGIRIGDFVYANDVIRMPEESKKYLHGMKAFVVDCIKYENTGIHAGLDTVLEWDNEFKPEKVFLTNMSHDLDYHEVKQRTPEHFIPCHDGIKIPI